MERREQVSQVLGSDEKAPLPKDNVFAVQNYHQESSAQDPGELSYYYTITPSTSKKSRRPVFWPYYVY